FPDGLGVRHEKAIVGVVRPVAEAVDTQRPGVLAGGHARPSRDRDGRDHALQLAIEAAPTKAIQVRQLTRKLVEHERGLRAVQSNDRYARPFPARSEAWNFEGHEALGG